MHTQQCDRSTHNMHARQNISRQGAGHGDYAIARRNVKNPTPKDNPELKIAQAGPCRIFQGKLCVRVNESACRREIHDTLHKLEPYVCTWLPQRNPASGAAEIKGKIQTSQEPSGMAVDHMQRFGRLYQRKTA